MPKACVPHEADGGCFQARRALRRASSSTRTRLKAMPRLKPRVGPVEVYYARIEATGEREVRGLVDGVLDWAIWKRR